MTSEQQNEITRIAGSDTYSVAGQWNTSWFTLWDFGGEEVFRAD